MWLGRIEARTGLRMMPTFPRSPLSFRTAGFPQYGWKAGISGETCRPLALGFGAQHIQLHQSPTDAVLNAVERIHIETLRQARKQFAKSPRHLIKCAGGRPSDQWMGV